MAWLITFDEELAKELSMLIGVPTYCPVIKRHKKLYGYSCPACWEMCDFESSNEDGDLVCDSCEHEFDDCDGIIVPTIRPWRWCAL